MIADGNDYYYAHDHLYSPAALIDSSGTVLERYEYDAYGNCIILEPNFAPDPDGKSDYGNPYLFTGRELDVLDNGNLKIYNYRYRSYDTLIGRFLQHDQLGINPSGGIENPFWIISQYEDGANLYEFVQSNPAIFRDPLGLLRIKLADFDWDSGRLPLIIIWVQIKLKGEVYLDVLEGVSKKDCPKRTWPRNIQSYWDVDFN